MPNNTDPIDPNTKLKLLVYGTFKIGKSWGAGTFPRPNFLDFDKGINLFRNPEFVAKYGLRSIMYEQFTEHKLNSRGVAIGHNALDDASRYFDKCMTGGERDKFDTWVIDSGTILSEAAATKAMILLGGTDFGKPLSFTHKQALNTGLVHPKKQDYGAERSMVEQFVEMVKDTDKHVILICHEKQITDDDGNILDIVPLLTGKSAQSIPLKFEEVWMVRVKKDGPKTVRYLQTHADALRRCGTHLGIPDGCAWEWDAIQAELTKIRSAQAQAV